MRNKIKWILIHHSAGTDADYFADTSKHTIHHINEWHKKRGFPKSELGWNIGYHYVLFPDGNYIQTRRDTEIGCHCIGMNKKSLSILMIGNFNRVISSANHKPTDEQKIGLRKWLLEKTDKHNVPISHIVGHRFFCSYKNCPGENVSDNFGQELVKKDIGKIDLLKKQISIIEKIIKIYVLLLNQLVLNKKVK